MRFTIRITGESGQGINSMGEILTKALKNSGYYTFGYREYPSLIKGGVSMYQLEISDTPVNSTSNNADVMFSISRFSLHHYISSVKERSHVFHTFTRNIWPDGLKELVDDRGIQVEEINADEATILAGGTRIMTNVYILGYLWDLLGQDVEVILEQVKEQFSKRKDLLIANEKVLRAGFTSIKQTERYQLTRSHADTSKLAMLTGNHSVALGAYSAGCRAYYSYPMTPASSVLSILAEISHDTGMLVRQVEDEISAAQMMLGSMYMGTRAMTGTSGGGFDLMTESLSFSGMAEIPAVFLLAQRPGPATGLPTWTSSSDLNIALYAGHGEFPRVVMSISDTSDAIRITGEAFNIAEKFQVPVIILTDKHLAESLFLTDVNHQSITIERGISTEVEGSEFRYQLTDSGISPRWLPGSSEKVYITNSDEHSMDGSSTEDMEVSKAMYDKRLQKLTTIHDDLPEPIYRGYDQPKVVFIAHGSVLNVINEAIDKLNIEGAQFGSLKYEYISPLRTEFVDQLYKNGVTLVVVEQNATGQFEKYLVNNSEIKITDRYRRYDGKPIFYDEMVNFMRKFK